MLFDTHAHYDASQFDEDREALLASMEEAGVGLILSLGTDLETSRFNVSLAHRWPFLYAAVGYHPEEAETFTEAGFSEIRRLAMEEPKVRAIGEIGLDYHYADGASPEVQQALFHRQLELAEELDLPAVVHSRDATRDTLEVIAAHPKVRGVLHCFGESRETAKLLLDLGWYLSFTGSVTFKNARKAPEVAATMPLDRLMLETDSPYMAPVPLRGHRNDSRNLRYIRDFIAALRGMDPQELEKITWENGKRFFGIA